MELIVLEVTAFTDPSIIRGDTRGEIIQGKTLVDAAKEVGVQFFVWRSVCVIYFCSEVANSLQSSLPNGTELSKGKYSGVLQFDGG